MLRRSRAQAQSLFNEPHWGGPKYGYFHSVGCLLAVLTLFTPNFERQNMCTLLTHGGYSEAYHLDTKMASFDIAASANVATSEISNDMNGLILTLASSAACVLGSLVICLDVVWRWISPSSKFDFNNNQNFLVGSLSLSSGVLIFTSLYKLLPQAKEYYAKSTLLGNSPKLAQAVLISTYILGIVVCSAINTVIHALTSQSVVHCAHDGPGEEHDHHHGHDHSHHHSHSHDHGEEPGLDHPSNAHNHTHDHAYHSLEQPLPSHNDRPVFHIPRYGSSENVNGHENCQASSTGESTPLLSKAVRDVKTLHKASIGRSKSASPSLNVKRRRSLIDFTDWKFRGKKYSGKCMGYSDIEDCCDICSNDTIAKDDPHTIFDYVEPDTMVHRHIHLNSTTEGMDLHTHYHRPSLKTSLSQRSINHLHIPPDIPESSSTETEVAEAPGNLSSDQTPADTSRSFSSDEESQEEDEDVHHHHISTRYSHLFSIGLQTAFAISVHKIPEGFLTFATSHADRELGFSVFVALAIHNISEGFTIAFPLFLALRSRFLAIMSAVVLGGMSQPLGALFAWFLFHFGFIPGGDDGMENGKTDFIFGLIVSITAGFLSIIGFQMYGTAISFGGKQNVTLTCAFAGIAIIGLGGSLTAH